MKLCMWDFWEYCDQKISPKISIFSASEPASSPLQLQPMRRGASPGSTTFRLCASIFSIEWRRSVKTCKFWFRVRRRGKRWTRNVFLYYFMKWNILSFFQIWLFPYLPCLLTLKYTIYNVIFHLMLKKESSILFVIVSCSVDMSFVSVYTYVLYWCV